MKNIVSFSGGKDSTAMLLMMLEKEIPVDEIYFADTGVEFPEMYKYIDKIEKHIEQPIIRLQPKKSWDDYFYATYKRGKRKGEKYGFPAVVYGCWARPKLKTEQLDKIHLPGNNIYIGIAVDEKERTNRKAYTNGDCNYKFPLVEWGMAEQDCVDYLAVKGLENPLYDRFSRLGCWMCPKQNLKSLKSLYLHYPNLWAKLKQYEKDSPHGFRLDYTLEELELRFKIGNEFLQQYEIPDNPKLRKAIISDLRKAIK